MRVSIKAIGKLKPVLPNLEKIIRDEQEKERKTVLREFESTTRTWSRQPDFKSESDKDGIEVGTNDEIYGYVNDGTRPHIIRAKRAKRLRFYASGFVSKTVAGRLNPRGGRKASKNLVMPLVVLRHPGTQARNFASIIKKRSEARFARNLQRRLKQDLGA